MAIRKLSNDGYTCVDFAAAMCIAKLGINNQSAIDWMSNLLDSVNEKLVFAACCALGKMKADSPSIIGKIGLKILEKIEKAKRKK
jgi:hypothetical protein